MISIAKDVKTNKYTRCHIKPKKQKEKNKILIQIQIIQSYNTMLENSSQFWVLLTFLEKLMQLDKKFKHSSETQEQKTIFLSFSQQLNRAQWSNYNFL